MTGRNPVGRMRRLSGDFSENLRDRWIDAPRWARWAVYAGVVALAIVAPSPVIASFMSPYTDWTSLLFNPIGTYILLALGLNIVVGQAGLLDLGYVAFFAIGAYTLAYLGIVHGFPYWPTVVLGVLIAAVSGVILGAPTLRLRGDYLAIVTLGFGEIVRVLIQRTGDVLAPADAAHTALPETLSHLGGALGFPGLADYTRIFYVYAAVTIVVVCAYRLKISSRGRALLAVRENEVAAEAVGIHTARVKVSAFVMSALFAGIGGGLFAHELGTTLSPRELGFQKSIDIVIMVVLGGMGSISGVILAAAILTVMPELFREFSDYRMPIYALALIIVMIVRPGGLFGIRELWDTRLWQRIAGPRRGPRAIARTTRREDAP